MEFSISIKAEVSMSNISVLTHTQYGGQGLIQTQVCPIIQQENDDNLVIVEDTNSNLFKHVRVDDMIHICTKRLHFRHSRHTLTRLMHHAKKTVSHLES